MACCGFAISTLSSRPSLAAMVLVFRTAPHPKEDASPGKLRSSFASLAPFVATYLNAGLVLPCLRVKSCNPDLL